MDKHIELDLSSLDKIKADSQQELASAADLHTLHNVKAKYLGKEGLLSQQLLLIPKIPIAERKIFGQQVNQLKQQILERINTAKERILAAKITQDMAKNQLDLTLPAPDLQIKRTGGLHPINSTLTDLVNSMQRHGFNFVTTQDIEDEEHNFNGLNMPAHHPARQMQDTFYFDGPEQVNRRLLRTHTTGAQIHYLRNCQPPIRLVTAGKVYRNDHDATHSPMFHQMDVFAVEKGLNLAHLKWLLTSLLQEFFNEPQLKIRLRPSFFPFTEPSFEIDIGYHLVKGEMQLGGQEQYLEILGGGMMHPQVLANVGLGDYQGFAFGVGIERLAMLKYGIKDLRSMFDNDLRWLNHYNLNPLY